MNIFLREKENYHTKNKEKHNQSGTVCCPYFVKDCDVLNAIPEKEACI